jgi:hypothetical protein
MLSLDEALTRLLEVASERVLTRSETLPTMAALGRVLADDVRSGLDVPPADNTSMDGYAMRCADVPAPGAVLPVSQRIPAGVVGAALAPGSAARIFTGAQIPAGADAVVMQEQCVALDGGAVRVETVPMVGQWIRRRGEDIARGALVLARGAVLTPQALGLAASVGCGPLAEDARRFHGAGLRDTTRVGGSPPELWAGILLDNRDATLAAAAAFRAELDRIERAITVGDRAALVAALARGADWRSTL